MGSKFFSVTEPLSVSLGATVGVIEMLSVELLVGSGKTPDEAPETPDEIPEENLGAVPVDRNGTVAEVREPIGCVVI